MSKGKARLNIVDIVVIAALAVALFWLVFNTVKGLGSPGESVSVTCVIKADAMRSELAAKAAEGDAVYDANGSYIGRVTTTSTSPAYYSGADAEGTPVLTRIEGESVLYLTLEAAATKRDNGYYSGDILLAAGEGCTVRTPQLQLEGEYISVKPVE